ncbi:sigma-70 family RNA polymerase sigma factor [Butyricicoccus sp. 1XD8-22]|nr:sigma-70 family RNA polymerase sigma factor [Butyricicoccus sp. 1XD8-22]
MEVISLEKKQRVLIAFHQDDKSQRQIAKELGISWNTVKNILKSILKKESKIFENYLLQITM